MKDQLAGLTDKEKEALRLLLAGHDAKSSGRALGVSHHAINDRLRSARRKLSAGSSREAALRLAEAEGASPERLVHKPLGAAVPIGNSDDRSSALPSGQDTPSPGWRRKGLIIMSITIIAGAIAIAVSGTPEAAHPPAASSVSQSADERPASESGAREFLALLDKGDAEASYAAAAAPMRLRHNFDMWELGVALRKNRGAVQIRKLTSVERQEASPQYPGQVVEVLVYEAQLLGGDRYHERLVLQKDGGAWKVADYDMTRIEQK